MVWIAAVHLYYCSSYDVLLVESWIASLVMEPWLVWIVFLIDLHFKFAIISFGDEDIHEDLLFYWNTISSNMPLHRCKAGTWAKREENNSSLLTQL